MGGLALSAWNHVRSTQDVDILVGIGDSAHEDILALVAAAGFRPRRTPPIADLGTLQALQLEYEPEETYLSIHVDLLLSNSAYHQQALARRVWRKIPDFEVEIAILSCEDLVLHKLLAGRLIDLADAVAVLTANRNTMDIAYLKQWSGKLGVSGGFQRAWDEATSSS
jgi:hypothetical protein